MHKYRASGKAPINGIFLLFIAAVVIGAVVGGLLWAPEHFFSFYLVALFPILAGAIVGGVLGAIVKSAKIRSGLIVAVFAILAVAIAFGVYHFASYYISFRGETPEVAITELLENTVGESGFVGYLKYEAQIGFSITRSFSSSGSIDLQGDVVYAYWIAEAVVAALIAIAMGVGAAGQPFDEKNQMWYGGATPIAATLPKARKELLNALKAGDFRRAGSMFTPQDLKYPRIEVHVRRSDNPDSDVYVQVMQVQRKGRATPIQQGMMTASEFNTFANAMQIPS